MSTPSRVALTLTVALVTGSGVALAAPRACVEKSGSATGLTRDFAHYESLLIIRQVTGNWPLETDHIVETKSSCKPDDGSNGVMWTCVTRAKVCKTG